MKKPGLTDECHRAIFSVEKQELQDSSVDYTLLTTCRRMIRQFCHEEDQSQALVCLKVNDYITHSVGRVPQGNLRSKVNGTIFHSLFRYLYFFHSEGFKITQANLFSMTHCSVIMYLFYFTFNCLFY